MSRFSSKAKAFTLVELLVVIGIIALLISILLPALTKARGAAASVKCMANMRSIMQGMQMYASQNHDWIPGAYTSGQYLLSQNDTYSTPHGPYGEANCPDLLAITDWMSPIAATLGTKFNRGPALADRIERYQQLVVNGMFRCPSNSGDLLSTHYGSGGDMGTLPMPSYFEAQMFTFVHTNSNLPRGVTTSSASNRIWGSASSYDVPQGYSPKISKIRNSPQKIAIAEGARYVDGVNPPDYDSNITGGSGGFFADEGPWNNKYSHAIFLGQVPGNGSTGTYDGRIPMRHGGRQPFSAPGTYKGNFAFWDGHVETMNDVDMSKPDYWMPTGSNYTVSSVWPVTVQRFNIPSTPAMAVAQ
ncbi:MAG: type II secretion system protein [Tepidisphaeraceae bacterium]